MSDGAVHRAATRLYRIMGRATAHDSLDDLPDQVRESYLRDAEKLLDLRCPHCGGRMLGEEDEA